MINQKFYKLPVLLLAVLLLFSAAYYFGSKLRPAMTEAPDIEIDSSCNPATSRCQLEILDDQFAFYFEGEASALQPFGVVLDAQGLKVSAVSVRFYMDDMDMGEHRYSIFPQQKNNGNDQTGLWYQQVILPVCTLSRRDWRVDVHIRYKDSLILARFKFQQSNNKAKGYSRPD